MMFEGKNFSFELGKKTYVMGILNVTKDSFADGGKYNTPEKAREHVAEMLLQGADVIDIGAQSTRPDSQLITPQEELEIIKQLNDIACLFEQFNDIEAVRDTYIKTAKLEIGFRGLNSDYKDCLKDTMRACLSIMSKGLILRDDYKFYLTGIRKKRGHIIGYKYNPDIAADQAAKTLYLCSCLLSESTFRKNIKATEYSNITKLPNEL